MEPIYHHECNQCVYLGLWLFPVRSIGGAVETDLYFCPGGGSPDLIARFGDRYTQARIRSLDFVTNELFPHPTLKEALRRYQTMKICSVIPAYGRDYKSKKEIEGSLLGDLDFTISDMMSPYDGKYINLPQIKEAGYTHINVRYSKLRKVAVLEVAKLKKTEITESP